MFSALTLALLGLIIGSFLNVMLVRRGVRSVGGRSGCFSCGTRLHALDMIPVLSWLVLRGRCRSCGSAMSTQYPLVETTTALLFFAVGLVHASLFYQLYFALMCVFLVLIGAYDIRHTIIPDEWAYSFAGLALLAIFFPLHEGGLLYAFLAGPIAALPLFLLWLVSKGRWMGLGDAKLALGIGWLLGPVYGPFAILFAFVVGAAISLLILIPLPYLVRFVRGGGKARGIRHLSYTMKSEVPFGPFLILSTLFVWFSLMYHIPVAFMP